MSGYTLGKRLALIPYLRVGVHKDEGLNENRSKNLCHLCRPENDIVLVDAVWKF